jgi:Protein of unknown function, DUF488
MGEEFADGLAQLRELAAARRAAMMCSEALWWRCHRRLVIDGSLPTAWSSPATSSVTSIRTGASQRTS